MQRRGKATLYELMRTGSGESASPRAAGGGFSLGSGALEQRVPWKGWTIIVVLVLIAGATAAFFVWPGSSKKADGGGVPPAPVVAPTPSVRTGVPATPQPSPTAVTADGRVVGLNYLVVLNGEAAAATALADFLRSKGLDARAVSGNNTGLSKVFVLPGSPTGADEAAGRLKDAVKAAGRQWKATRSGNPDLSDCYYEKFKG